MKESDIYSLRQRKIYKEWLEKAIVISFISNNYALVLFVWVDKNTYILKYREYHLPNSVFDFYWFNNINQKLIVLFHGYYALDKVIAFLTPTIDQWPPNHKPRGGTGTPFRKCRGKTLKIHVAISHEYNSIYTTKYMYSTHISTHQIKTTGKLVVKICYMFLKWIYQITLIYNISTKSK